MKIESLVLTLALLLPLAAFGESDCNVISPEGIVKYEGECKNGFAHGQGTAWLPTRFYADGYYQGYFVNGKLHGRARYLWAGGAMHSPEEWFYKGAPISFEKYVESHPKELQELNPADRLEISKVLNKKAEQAQQKLLQEENQRKNDEIRYKQEEAQRMQKEAQRQQEEAQRKQKFDEIAQHNKDVKAGKIPVVSLKDAQVFYDAKDGGGIVRQPPIASDHVFYTLVGKLVRKDGALYIFEMRMYNDTKYFATRLTPRTKYEKGFALRFESTAALIGQFVDITNYTTIGGVTRVAPIFDAVMVGPW